jgi:DNA polymerase-3 subunit delta
VAELKPAYLIWGDDEVKLDAWRARLRARAKAEGPTTALEILKGDGATAEATVAAIGSLTLSVGRRYVLVDGIQRWSDRNAKLAAAALADMPPETVVVMIGLDKPPAALVKAVEQAGGEVHQCAAPKGAAYPRWASDRARELGFELDREAAEVLVERAPRDEKRRLRQQHLMRELEKLSIFAGEGDRIGSGTVEALTSSAVEARAYELADAVVEGDSQRVLQIAEDLRARGEDMMHILFAVLRELRNCHRTWALIASGKSFKDVQSELRVPPFVARRLVAQAKRTDGERLERALELLADLDYAIRGAGRLDSDSALTLTLTRAASDRRAA